MEGANVLSFFVGENMKHELLKGTLNPVKVVDVAKYNIEFRKAHPEYFDPEGILVFCGPQGSGKTLSAVQYALKLCQEYPLVKVVTNMDLHGFPSSIDVIEWSGVKDFTEVENGYAGVIYLIDEIHLEFNSLESKQMDSNIFTVVSQQRKQRKHIVGTSQVFMRIAKPFREQFNHVVLCQNFFRCFQYNQLVDGKTATEKDGKLSAQVQKKVFWFHTSELYKAYDTYAVMKRYRKDWGVKR